MNDLYKIRSLNHIYQGTINTPALYNINLLIYIGEIICFAGPSGSGKTTLLNCIAGQLRPSSGQVIFKNEDLMHFFGYSKTEIKEIGAKYRDVSVLEGGAPPSIRELSGSDEKPAEERGEE